MKGKNLDFSEVNGRTDGCEWVSGEQVLITGRETENNHSHRHTYVDNRKGIDSHGPHWRKNPELQNHTFIDHCFFSTSMCMFMGKCVCVCFYCAFLSVYKILGLDFSIWPACFGSLYLSTYLSIHLSYAKWVFLYEKCKQ